MGRWLNLTHAQQGQSGLDIENKLKEGKGRIREPVQKPLQ